MVLEVFDDILNSNEQDLLLNYVENNSNWVDIKNITGDYANKFNQYSFPAKVIPSTIVNDDTINGIVDKIQNIVCQKIKHTFVKNYRWKINWTIPLNGDYNPLDLIHIDSNVQHIAIIYYINDSSGDTHIFNNINGNNAESNFLNQYTINGSNVALKRKITPKMGRVIAFDGNLLHYGDYPKYGDRFVLNINLATKFKTELI